MFEHSQCWIKVGLLLMLWSNDGLLGKTPTIL